MPFVSILNRLLKHSDVVIAASILGSLFIMIIPISANMMDVLFVCSFALAITILLIGVYSGRPLDFSVFPTILLFTTLFRLSLNIASTRLILLKGHEGTHAAGKVIQAFGEFVVGGSYIVGTVVFILLIIINFVVITKGAGRVAEVAARFILDAMPGKQMAIDADLNAGLISEEDARRRREEIEKEADFYGAMDGASKFVRGDAIAGILIVIVNVLGGFSIGILQRGLDFSKALELYTLMTIGDGLVTQIPALIVSTSAGIVVTRAASGSEFSKEVTNQIIFQPRAIGMTAVILFLLGLIPGLPAFPFMVFASIVGFLAYVVSEKKKDDLIKEKRENEKAVQVASMETNIPPLLDILELQIGYGLVKLVESETSEVVERIYKLRKEFAKELGIIVPKVRIRDNLTLEPNEYAILIRGVGVASGKLMTGHSLAMDSGHVEKTISGIETKEPVFGLGALWIEEKNTEEAQLAGYTVVDLPTIITTHLSEIIRTHAHELLGRQEMQNLIDNVSKTHPKVVEELIPNIMPLGTVLKVCKNLLKEQVPIRDLLIILETLANYGTQYKDPDVLTEFVRTALSRVITNKFSAGSSTLEVITMSPQVEQKLVTSYQKTDSGAVLNMEPHFFESLVIKLQKLIDATVFNSGNPVLLCHPLIRSQLRKLIERFIPNLSIMSANEIAPSVLIKSVATLEV